MGILELKQIMVKYFLFSTAYKLCSKQNDIFLWNTGG